MTLTTKAKDSTIEEKFKYSEHDQNDHALHIITTAFTVTGLITTIFSTLVSNEHH